jgi:hypothetical protein
MPTWVTMSVGIISTGRAPIYTSRTVNYTDISDPLTTFTHILTNPPFLEFLPVPPPPPVEEEVL